MQKSSSTFGTIGIAAAVVALTAGFLVLGFLNPALSEYESQVLEPATQQHKSASDAVLVSVLQSISLPGDAGGKAEKATPVTMLSNRTKRSNYVVFSVYSTEFDYCHGSSARAVGRTLGIAGKFYTLEKGDCRNDQRG